MRRRKRLQIQSLTAHRVPSHRTASPCNRRRDRTEGWLGVPLARIAEGWTAHPGEGRSAGAVPSTITPPLRGSRQIKGAARGFSGGGTGPFPLTRRTIGIAAFVMRPPPARHSREGRPRKGSSRREVRNRKRAPLAYRVLMGENCKHERNEHETDGRGRGVLR